MSAAKAGVEPVSLVDRDALVEYVQEAGDRHVAVAVVESLVEGERAVHPVDVVTPHDATVGRRRNGANGGGRARGSFPARQRAARDGATPPRSAEAPPISKVSPAAKLQRRKEKAEQRLRLMVSTRRRQARAAPVHAETDGDVVFTPNSSKRTRARARACVCVCVCVCVLAGLPLRWLEVGSRLVS